MFENSKLSKRKIKKIIECFCIDIDATRAAMLLKLNRKTLNRYYMAFRRLIYADMLSKKGQIAGVVEIDESSFGPKDGYRRRNASLRLVFGIYERDGSVYTELIADCSAKTLQAIILGAVSPESVVNTDAWEGYDGLAEAGYAKHFRVGKKRRQDDIHINGIEAFWSFAKRRLAKFNGTKRYFELHIKECEWRYNKTAEQLVRSLQRLLSGLARGA